MLSQLPLMYHSAMKEIIHSNGLTEQVSVRYRNGAELVRTGIAWDVVVCDLVSPQGTLHTGILEELEALWYVCMCTGNNCRIRPVFRANFLGAITCAGNVQFQN